MLSRIHIENMAVIEKCEIEFKSGFNVLTGETGAGKSIIIDSICALLGQRTSREVVRHGCAKGVVLGVFNEISPTIVKILEENGIEIENDEIYVQREITSEGKSTCRINQKPVTAGLLKDIAPFLINIHGQHDGQRLLSDSYHVNYLDSFGGNFELYSQYKAKFSQYYDIKKELLNLESENDKIEDKIEYLKFLTSEIEMAEILPNEEQELKQKKAVYQNYEKTAKALNAVHQSLSQENNGAYDISSKCSFILSEITEISDKYKGWYDKSVEIKYQIQELMSSVENEISAMDFDQNELDAIEERLDLIYNLKLKYGGTFQSISDTYEKSKSELEKIQDLDKNIIETQEKYQQIRAELIEIGKKLSEKRKSEAVKLENAIISELETLDMAEIKFKVQVEGSGKLSANGIDNVAFLIATNKGDVLKPLSKIASGGELSRIMLALKNILTANEEVGTLIFDEIDTGVSGRAAAKIAQKLYDVSTKKQVFCVSHLAYIAAMGDNHYLINKSHTEEKTFTIITEMSINEREKEIARIIGGDILTEITIKNSKELIENTNLYKKGV